VLSSTGLQTQNVARLAALQRTRNKSPHQSSQGRYLFFYFLFFNLYGWTFGTAATTGLFYQPRMIGDGDCGEIGGMSRYLLILCVKRVSVK
jgi:hypothetical protein